MNYYTRFIGDYLRDTMHLTASQDGFYNRILDLYYSTEKPLDLDREKLYVSVRANTQENREDVNAILLQFFKQTPRGYRNKKADEVIKHYRSICSRNKRNGEKGGRPKTQSVKSGFRLGNPNETYPYPYPYPEPKPKASEVVVEVSSSIKSSACSESVEQKTTPRAKARPSPTPFEPPTFEQVKTEMILRGVSPSSASAEAEAFIAHHANRDWHLGNGTGRRMKSWKLAVVTWHSNIEKFGGKGNYGNGNRARGKTSGGFFGEDDYESVPITTYHNGGKVS